MNIIETLRSRFRPEWKNLPDNAGLARMFENAVSFIDAPKLKHAALTKTGALSLRGVAEELRRDLGKHVVPEIRRVQREVNAQRDTLKTERKHMVKPKIDTTDLAAAVMRQEIRTYLRGLDTGERMKVLLNKPDANLLAAALEAPSALSGLTDEMRAHVEHAFVEANHKPRLAVLEEKQDVLDLVGAAADIATMEIRTYTGLEGQEFHSWFAGADSR